MMTSIRGHYNGSHIVPDENIALVSGQQVIITVLNVSQDAVPPATAALDLSRYMGRGKKLFDIDAQEYVRELRDNDRL